MLATLEAAYGGPPGGSITEWRRPGERVVAFLSHSREGRPLYIPTTYAQSFYIVDGE